MNNEPTARQIAIAVLAAGSSRRLGTPKQLLPYKGKSLLRHVVETARDARPSTTAVVLGPHRDELERELPEEGVTIIPNEEWLEGLGSSIRAAVRHFRTDADALLLVAVDQPLVDSRLLQSLMFSYLQSPVRVVACTYGGTSGIPALFDRELFPELARIEGDRGAKEIIAREGNNARLVPFPNGAIDIDTLSDYKTISK